jgi:hypothetical protein
MPPAAAGSTVSPFVPQTSPAAAPGVATAAGPALLLGQQVGLAGAALGLPLSVLQRHVAVLASPGSGKTVLLRRLAEEAALQRIPSIIVDAGNDLARLADAWPEAPQGWGPGDEGRAARYLQDTEVCVWTPGEGRGRPLDLTPALDFAGLGKEECDEAIEMTVASLGSVIAPSNSSTAQRRKGLLTAVLKYFAVAGGRGLDALIQLLGALPPEASSGDTRAAKLAVDMADLLRAQAQSNPLWRPGGAPLDAVELLGVGARRTRVSVISLTGLPSAEARQAFVDSLAIALHTWIARQPGVTSAPRGLLLIDEVKDLVPWRNSTLCKESLLRLAARGRRHSLGLVLASQEPQTVDPHIVSSCATQIYGKAGSAPAIERVRAQIQSRGGQGHDIASLTPGQFYMSLEGTSPPVRMAASMCLSWHPGTPLATDEALARARAW